MKESVVRKLEHLVERFEEVQALLGDDRFDTEEETEVKVDGNNVRVTGQLHDSTKVETLRVLCVDAGNGVFFRELWIAAGRQPIF